MPVLVDTNVLLILAQSRHPHADLARNSIDALRSRGETMLVAAQNLIEFWAVATRPKQSNGWGVDTRQAERDIAGLKQLFQVLPENPGILEEWERIVSKYQVLGKNAHDARLVAAMIVNGVDKILTFDQDFVRFREIQVLDPRTVK
jgi:predicted nucleic acid-binding protein